MPARSFSKGTDHAAQYPRGAARRSYDNQYNMFCSACSAHKLQTKGRKYWTCLTCGTRTKRGSLALRSPDLPVCACSEPLPMYDGTCARCLYPIKKSETQDR